MGDLNYRLDCSLSTDDLFKKARSHYSLLLPFDQLHSVQQQQLAFTEFTESAITFPPTYKYIKGTNDYDDRPRKLIREPAWCDRVLYTRESSIGEKPLIRNEKYDSFQEAKSSDHKPVYSILTVSSKRVNERLRNAIAVKENEKIVQWDQEKPIVNLSKQILDFGDVITKQRVRKQFSVVNNSNSNAYVVFLPQGSDVCKAWFSVTSTEFMLIPHEEKIVEVEVCISPQQARVG